MVWVQVSDISMPTDHSAELRSVEWLDGATGPAVGNRFLGRNERDDLGTWETISTITTCDEASALEWKVGDIDDPTSVWRFEISAINPARCELRFTFTLGSGPGRLRDIIAQRPDKESKILESRIGQLHAEMERTVNRVAQLSEIG